MWLYRRHPQRIADVARVHLDEAAGEQPVAPAEPVASP
jgi:hypothetical protein